MASTFTRLFRYAKAIGADARENYTTEALRACVATDSAPLALALRDARIADFDTSVSFKVDTQVAIRGVGQVDCVIAGTVEGRRTIVWLEIKVDAGESGNQIANYTRYIEGMQDGRRPMLVVLGPSALAERVPWFSWQQLRAAIIASKTSSSYWRDFKDYLEEIGMADSYDERVTESETKALPDARRLVGKVGRLLLPFAREAGALWPGSQWPTTETKVHDALLASFSTHHALAIGNATNLRANVAAGVYHEPTTEDAWLGVWIWCRPNRVHEREAIYARVRETSSWEEEWFTDESEWELFGAYRRLGDFGDHAEGSAWLKARLIQLRDARVLDLLSKLGVTDVP